MSETAYHTRVDHRGRWRSMPGSTVEVAAKDGMILMRNRDHPKVILTYTPAEWHAFLEGMKQGEFDTAGGTSD